MSEVINNYNKIIRQIENYKKEFSNSSRNPKLIAISKTFPSEIIQLLINHKHKIFGENKVQEANLKWSDLKKKNKDIELHLVGPLQTNKVKQALEIFDVIQTVDREKLAKKIKDHISQNFIREKKSFFIQVNTGDEPQKSGIELSKTQEFFSWCKYDLGINIIGLMCIPPVNEEPSFHFNILRDLCDKCKLKDASMGMTNDFKKAIQFGATYLRIGTGVFGNRG